MACAINLYAKINIEKNDLLNMMLNPSNLERNNLAIIIETFKIKMIIQSIILLSMNKRINELFDSPQSNKMMDASFARKKRANKHFDPLSLENQQAWISSQQEKITSQISQLENEIKEWKDKFQTEELTIDFDISIQDFKNINRSLPCSR